MANICMNELHVSCNVEDRERIVSFMKKTFNSEPYMEDPDGDQVYMEFDFESRWSFPNDLMDEMIADLKYKGSFDGTCLSVEWGCLYTAFHCSDGDSWFLEV